MNDIIIELKEIAELLETALYINETEINTVYIRLNNIIEQLEMQEQDL